jgi:hypothetical protein
MKLYIRKSQLKKLFDGKQSGTMAFTKPLDFGLPEEYTTFVEAEVGAEIASIIQENEVLKARLKKIKELSDD